MTSEIKAVSLPVTNAKLEFDRIVKVNDFMLISHSFYTGQDRNLHSHLCTETTKKC